MALSSSRQGICCGLEMTVMAMLNFVGKEGLFWLSGFEVLPAAGTRGINIAVTPVLFCCILPVYRKGDDVSALRRG